ncbi:MULTISPECIES: ribonuclease HI [Dehalobacter]|jgi:ribonuclease HI|uniref:Ribonuclease H n=2 Tax=Dehalobacter restrictus TaxID=55583 RepID=A0A857DIW3_9FIRM|nr:MULTISPECIES: ribonuclease HI [Dehalobacter]AHF09691.1 ribonuclease H [Dehalobacter restrictus DSM 9455]MCG1025625.1 ribonuclease HI [Dehalobacter sp.]MDJ0306535.1 ribonuclease HI [Dehalobacter sp.]OCZ51564.1 ribonuclease HI [Dehalobacter sp. TeCB1]QHA00285.1 ribonuclease HI [Dehalobacter restrictus]
MTVKSVKIYTDGACSGNPGPGGWAAILKYGEHEREISGFEGNTTNQRMELTAAVQGLAALKESCSVQVHSDSAYLINAFEQNWLSRWQKNGWQSSQKKPVENRDLWVSLVELTAKHDVVWVKVKGHSGHPENERCDELARKAIAEALA